MTCTCPNCQQDVAVDAPGDVTCSNCGTVFTWDYSPPTPAPPVKTAPPPVTSVAAKSVPEPPPLRVVVVDFDMSVMSMVGIMVKAAVAAIPAAMIIAALVLAFGALMSAVNG
jgi:hypothetical protein